MSKGERTRSRILDSATELFSRSGFHAVSLRDIAAHAGLTHAGLLHHFRARSPSSSRCSAGATGPMRASCSPPAPTPTPRTARVHRRPGRTEHAYAGPGRPLREDVGRSHRPRAPAHRYFIQRYRILRERLSVIFAALFERAVPPLDHDPAAVAQQLIALMDGLQNQWLLDPEATDMHASVRLFMTRLGLDLSWLAEPAPQADSG
ncbi:TetR/AcrR family transcriptional regulator [Streptomyces sp. M10(2022)]